MNKRIVGIKLRMLCHWIYLVILRDFTGKGINDEKKKLLNERRNSSRRPGETDAAKIVNCKKGLEFGKFEV